MNVMVKMVKGVSFSLECERCRRKFVSLEAKNQHDRDVHSEAAIAKKAAEKAERKAASNTSAWDRKHEHHDHLRRAREIHNTDYGLARRNVEWMIDADRDRLYGNIAGAIKYLAEVEAKYEGATLSEHWTGYETMEMVFTFMRGETDEEYETRIEHEADRAERRREEAERVRLRDVKQRQIAKLQGELRRI